MEQSSTPERAHRPNVVVILADDLGYSDIGPFGGEIPTPNLDSLAEAGVRATAVYNTARCSPSRASLLTGRHPHETGIGILTEPLADLGGYPGSLDPGIPTMAELLGQAGYATCLSGKWHLSSSPAEPDATWPTRRGFDEFFGIMPGADSYFHPRTLWHGETRLPVPTGDFYLTDAVSDHAAGFIRDRGDEPVFIYLAYTAPHWPLHAPESDVERHVATYEAGWDELRAARLDRLQERGIVPADLALPPRDEQVPAWQHVEHPEWEARRMATYAAMVERMDAGIGRVVEALRETGRLDDTMILFLSDNGGSSEDLPPANSPHFFARQPSHTPDGTPMSIGNDPSVVPGAPETYASYGRAWAGLSNTPFRRYKRWVHEGGIATPFIAHWPAGALASGSAVHHPFQLTDVLPTVLEAARAPGDARGESMLSALRGGPGEPHPLFWEHVGNAAVRHGDWKLVRTAEGPWELYDVERDRSELDDVASAHPDVVASLAASWQEWASAHGVIPWDVMREIVAVRGG